MEEGIIYYFIYAQGNRMFRLWMGLTALAHIRRCAHTPTTYMSERVQVVPDYFNRLVPFNLWPCRRENFRVGENSDCNEQSLYGTIRYEAKESAERY